MSVKKQFKITKIATDQISRVNQLLVLPLVVLDALLHVELLELLHLWVGLPRDQEAGVS